MPSPALRIVVPRFGSQIIGGSEGLARRIAGALSQRGWTIEVWSTTAEDESTWKGALSEHEVVDGYGVRRFPVAVRRRPAAFHQASRAFFRLPKPLRPDSVWLRAQGPYSPRLVAALTTANAMPTLFTPYLYYPTVYGLPAAPHPRLLIPAAHDERPLYMASVGRAFSAADALLFGTAEEQQLVESVHPQMRNKLSAVGTVGTEDRDPGNAERFRSRYDVRGPFFFYGGRAATGKGIDVLLDGFRLLQRTRREAQLVIAGTGLPRDLPAGVFTTGRLDDAQWRDALAASRAVIIPSSMESLSLLALDAWAAARPCVVNAQSPVLRGQVMRSKGGLIFDGADDLALQLTTLADSPTAADQLGTSGRDYVQRNYRWDDVAQRLQALIEAAAH